MLRLFRHAHTNRQYVDPPPYHPPKPSKKTEEALIASVARYQAEAERREREKAQAAAMKNGTSNGTNGHESEDKPAKADTPHQ